METASRSHLPTLPGGRWRERRRRNFEAFRAALGSLPGVRVLDAPFAATLLFDSASSRDGVRRALVEARIYPAVVWPLEGERIPHEHIDLSRRVLSLHCDYRYDEGDMRRVASGLRKALVGQG